jgi:hypothetical protein
MSRGHDDRAEQQAGATCHPKSRELYASDFENLGEKKKTQSDHALQVRARVRTLSELAEIHTIWIPLGVFRE